MSCVPNLCLQSVARIMVLSTGDRPISLNVLTCMEFTKHPANPLISRPPDLVLPGSSLPDMRAHRHHSRRETEGDWRSHLYATKINRWENCKPKMMVANRFSTMLHDGSYWLTANNS